MKVVAYCDGSGTIASQPACIGVVVLVDDVPVVEVSEFVGLGTNNLAELRALRRAMWLVAWIFGIEEPATICSDSAYAIGMTEDASRYPSAHEQLVQECRKQYQCFGALRFLHVPSHSGVFGNELADWLAGEARARWLVGQGFPSKKKRKARPELAPIIERDDPKPNSPEDVGFPARS